MEHASDAVSAEIAHHRKAVTLGVALDRIADRADMHPRTHDRDAAHHRLVGHVDELSRLDRDAIADKEHAAGITVPALDDNGHVDIDDVAFDQPAIARNAVADDM